MRHTRAHTKNRRSHHALKAPTLAVCANCNESHRPHHMCLNCGFYKGRQVIDLELKQKEREARKQAKSDQIKAQYEQAALSEAEEKSEQTPEENTKSKK